jgi:hypothetical protein
MPWAHCAVTSDTLDRVRVRVRVIVAMHARERCGHRHPIWLDHQNVPAVVGELSPSAGDGWGVG